MTDEKNENTEVIDIDWDELSGDNHDAGPSVAFDMMLTFKESVLKHGACPDCAIMEVMSLLLAVAQSNEDENTIEERLAHLHHRALDIISLHTEAKGQTPPIKPNPTVH